MEQDERMPRVSVIVPTYNRGDVLARAIESVLRQELRDLELIVVDDCSTDDTESIVESYDDPRVRYFRHETNRGGSAARNTGIEHATGEYVAFLDDDDEYRPKKLTKQVECLDRRSEECVAAYCNDVVRREGENPFDYLPSFVLNRWPGADAKPRPEGGEELVPKVLAKEFPLGGASTLMVRREVAEELGGFGADFPRHQDWEFLIRLLKAGEIAYVDEPLVVKHDTGRPSSDKVEAAKQKFFERFSSEIAAAERDGYDVTGIQRFDMAKLYFTNGEFLRGIQSLRDANIDFLELTRVCVLGTHAKLTATVGD
jgi:glycosyltransferase involved in cell wall biosynthesis